AILITGFRAFVARFGTSTSQTQARMFLVILVVGLPSFANNQSNIIMTGSLLWGAVAICDGRWWLAAACLALPGFKMYPWALGLLYSALYPRRFAWPFACAATLLFVLPFQFHPAAVVTERYFGVYEYVTESAHSQTYVLMNVRDFLVRWGWFISPRWFFLMQLLSGASILIALRWGRRHGISEAEVTRHGFVLTTL